MPLPIKFVVVSCPPTIVTTQLAMISSSVSRSPLSSAVMKEWIKPSRGLSRIFAIASRK